MQSLAGNAACLSMGEIPSRYTVREVSSLTEFLSLRQSWNNLLAASPANRVFLTHEWFTAWWGAFGTGRELLVLLVSQGENIVAIAPLMVSAGRLRGLPVRCIEFIANSDSPGCGFILRREHDDAVTVILDYLAQIADRWTVMRLTNIVPVGGFFHSMTEHLAAKCLRYLVKPGLTSPYLLLGDDYRNFVRGLSNRTRRSLRYLKNRMTRIGKVSVVEHKDVRGLSDALHVAKRGWKNRQGLSITSNPSRALFFRLLSDEAERKGWLSISCLYINGEPVAYQYQLNYRQCQTALLTDYDEKYSRESPGAFLDSIVVERLFASGMTEYDMCGSEDSYKMRWTDDVRRYQSLLVFHSRIYPRLLYAMEKEVVERVRALRALL